MARLQNKVAIVTGGASGFGAAIARLFAAEGATVVIADRNSLGATALAAEIGGGAVGIPLDVTQAAEWAQVVKDTMSRFGRLDILVNNAGIFSTTDAQDIEHMAIEEWRMVNAVNIDGVMLGCQAVIPAMRQSGGGGSIVNISSLSGIRATPKAVAYGASKGAVRQLTKSIAVHGGRSGDRIRCNSIHPSLVRTPMGDDVLRYYGGGDADKGAAERAGSAPLGGFATPDDIAYGALYLASDESRFVTGIELVIDGGQSCGR